MLIRPCLRHIVPLALAAWLAVPGPGQDAPHARNANKYFVLDNGLRILLYEKRGTPLVNMGLAVDLGSKDESEGTLGLAHLLEHCLLFRGLDTPDEDRTIGELRRNGAYFNGFTSQDLTVYELSLPADRSEFGLSTIKRIFEAADFAPEEIAREKAVILEEAGTLRDDPRRFAVSLLYENLFRGHPYGNNLFGEESAIRKAGPAELGSFHAKFYVPSNSALAVVGDFDCAGMEQRIRSVFGGLSGARFERPPLPPVSPPSKLVDIRKEMDVGEAYLAIGFVGPGYNNRDKIAAEVLTEILGRGFNPMLNSALRARRDLVKSTTMSFATHRAGGIFVILFTLDPRDVSQARNEGLAFLKKVRTLNFAKDDYPGDERFFALDYLRGAKNQIRFGGQKGRESGLHLASSFARHMLLAEGDSENDNYLERIGKITSSDLRETATRYLNQGEFVVVAVVPGKKT